MRKFNRFISIVQRETGREAKSYVTTVSRRLILRAAFRCPMSVMRWHPRRGRARAGFWPAAMRLGLTTIYTSAPNRGEGEGIDRRNNFWNPSFTIINSVAYIDHIAKHGLEWWRSAIRATMAQSQQDLDRSYRRAFHRSMRLSA
jgi:hypothetical protein